MKVGTNLESDLRRGKLIRSVIDDPAHLPASAAKQTRDRATLVGKNAGPTGNVLMMDANQVWDVAQAIEYVQALADIKPWFIEEPTAPDDVLGHATIRNALRPHGIAVATGEHAHNRMVFKQLMQVGRSRLFSEAMMVMLTSSGMYARPKQLMWRRLIRAA